MGHRLRKHIELREMGGAIAQRGRSLISTIALLILSVIRTDIVTIISHERLEQSR